MKEKQTMTLTQLFIEEYLEKKERLEKVENKLHCLKKSLVCAMNIVDSYRRMIADLEIERFGDNGEYISIHGFLGKGDIAFDLYNIEIEDREKMKKKEEEKTEEKEDDQKEETTDKDTEEETTNE